MMIQNSMMFVSMSLKEVGSQTSGSWSKRWKSRPSFTESFAFDSTCQPAAIAGTSQEQFFDEHTSSKSAFAFRFLGVSFERSSHNSQMLVVQRKQLNIWIWTRLVDQSQSHILSRWGDHETSTGTTWTCPACIGLHKAPEEHWRCGRDWSSRCFMRYSISIPILFNDRINYHENNVHDADWWMSEMRRIAQYFHFRSVVGSVSLLACRQKSSPGWAHGWWHVANLGFSRFFTVF